MCVLPCDPVGATIMVACSLAKGRRFFNSENLLECHLESAKLILVEDRPGVQMSQSPRARALA